jgi:hypothetical protein
MELTGQFQVTCVEQEQPQVNAQVATIGIQKFQPTISLLTSETTLLVQLGSLLVQTECHQVSKDPVKDSHQTQDSTTTKTKHQFPQLPGNTVDPNHLQIAT